MAIELVFRVSYFVAVLSLVFYSRTLITATAIAAMAAWLAYGHPDGNSTGQEVLVFFIAWASAVATAAVIGGTVHLEWLIELEWRLVTHRAGLRLSDAVRWLGALVVAAVVYVCTEVVGYDQGTFYRLQSLALLLLLWMIIYFYDQVVSGEGYHLLSPQTAHRHKTVTAVVAVAVLIDILVRDPPFWRYLVPSLLAWLALQAFKVWLSPGVISTRFASAHQWNAKKSE